MKDEKLARYWKTVVDIIHDGVMIVDVGGYIVSVNQALVDITGYSQEELVGQPCSILGCSSCKKIYDPTGKHWCRLFSIGDVNMQKASMVRRDGTSVDVMKNASVLKEDGKIIGAVETLTDITELLEKENQIEAYRRELQAEYSFEGMVGVSMTMRRTFDMIANVAESDAPALIIGESGTGKELAARAIHQNSARKDRPYVQVNCAALNESVLESELFGHVKGAFTGAYQNREGRFEAANGGDIFLDEIGDLPQSIQIKLLRVLEEKVIERVGDNRSIPVDVRIITATNRDLKQLVDSGSFRGDFYYRINVLPIEIPPLRNRTEDIPVLAEMFFKHVQLKSNKPIQGISPEAMEALVRYSWPGNVRELKSAFEYAFVTCMESSIKAEHLPPDVHMEDSKRSKLAVPAMSLDGRKKQALLQALEQAGGNKSQAARILGVSRVTVWNQMHRYNLI
ncbi:sigma-54 interaction domain-containing protein [Desulfopila inferna]|uniref:sigma-54 interaction domain-containing protein n=1 Tax=Desulfopila inferna TaxID=468528 RepID=UPI0019667FC7|nr:sigma 54-interacting transcriptional regulator [Desulfopila inferna]MBM9604541.1 sigma 54-interacting transcriptional regulator [Desulfopila inferna]